jgi:hypothetical protein
MKDKMSPQPIHIREYPPFALAMGTTFLAWLTGSIAYDSFWGKAPDTMIGILFALFFLVLVLTALSSWTSLITIGRIGLYMNESGVTHIRSGWWLFNTASRSLSWQEVEAVELEKDNLLIKGKEKEKSLQVSTAGLLENPDWMEERGRAWLKTVNKIDSGDEVLESLEQVETEVAGIVCKACGGSIDVRLGESDATVCRFCGETQGLSAKVKDAIQRLSKLISDLPEAHRQFQEKTLRRFVAEGGKYRCTILGVGWGTAAVWIVFGSVNLISDLAREEVKSPDYVFPAVMLGLALLSVFTAYALATFIRRAAVRFSLPMQALAPVEAGGAARCRLCGAGLPAEGVLRRCEYCSTDSVVVGEQLAAAERAAGEAVQQAQKVVLGSTETAGRLLDSAAFKMQLFVYTQFLWLHVPVVVALDGSTGMLYRLTGTFLAMLAGNFASTFLGMRWLAKEH